MFYNVYDTTKICVKLNDLSSCEYQFSDIVLVTIAMACPTETHNWVPSSYDFSRYGDDISQVYWIGGDSHRKCKDQVSEIVTFSPPPRKFSL